MARPARVRLTTAWLQILLVGGLACVVLILAEAFRAARSSQQVAEHALQDYADFASFVYGQHLTTRLREAVGELLGPVNHGDGLHRGDVPSAQVLGHYLREDPECACHVPRYGPLPANFLGFALGTDTLGVGVNLAAPGSRGWLAGPLDDAPPRVSVRVYPPDEARWINGLLTKVARAPRSDWGYNVVVTRQGSTPRIFAIRDMPTYRGDTIVYGVEYAPRALDSLLRGVLATSPLLPPSLVSGRANRELVDIEVSDALGSPLFSSRSNTRWELDAQSVIPASYGGLRIRAQLRPELAQALLIGGVPRSRVPLLLAILVLAVGLSLLAASQLRREARFAGERATFVANVSHELRTPLSQVRLVLDTLRLGRATDAGTREQALGTADREVLRLQHLVEGVLRFTRGPRPDDAPRVRVDAAREARAVATEFAPLAAPRGIRIDVAGDEGTEIDLQHGALRQVLLNLLDNAVKYGRDHSVVSVEVRRRPGGGALISVTDTGPGVPDAERDRIWRPFERGSVARQRAAGGSGIGLTIVREIVEEHEGRAWVEGGPGGGARFVIDLPNLGH
ncbi:MAG TPA: HAMP domain-containing sensor histidine kinase [Gemmatimonadaceae bacterium]|nr:HAMP domain-containing sensor histidine kinase [Gemmatimonadaceae bacterium]